MDKFLETFTELLKSSTLIQGGMALVITLTIVYMYINQMSVPSELINILLIIIGFYFGTKTQSQLRKGMKEYEDNLSKHTDRQRKG